ncbi:MAG: hypothetical protein ACI4SF_08495 [Oscillospiraceae bacterium]
MYFVEKQQLWYDNVLSYRTRVEETDLLRLISHLETSLDALGLEQKGSIVFTIDERIETENKTILGVEFLVPVDRAFESSNRYVCKSCFKLENAVMSKFSGNLGELYGFAGNMRSCVESNHIKSITDIYYLVRSIGDGDCIIDLYLGTSGNIL